MFQPIRKKKSDRPTRYYEIIIQKINDMILKGTLQDGDNLPSERELAEMFRTSRVPVREAIKILEFLGIVEIIDGEGTFISSIEIPSLMDKIFFGFKIDDQTLPELFEIRVLLEGYAAGRAAKRRSEADLNMLKQSIEDMTNAQLYTDDLLQASKDFHNTVVRAAQNSILNDIYQFLSELVEMSRQKTLVEQGQLSIAIKYHQKIYAMIKDQDEEKAESLMREHLIDQNNIL